MFAAAVGARVPSRNVSSCLSQRLKLPLATSQVACLRAAGVPDGSRCPRTRRARRLTRAGRPPPPCRGTSPRRTGRRGSAGHARTCLFIYSLYSNESPPPPPPPHFPHRRYHPPPPWTFIPPTRHPPRRPPSHTSTFAAPPAAASSAAMRRCCAASVRSCAASSAVCFASSASTRRTASASAAASSASACVRASSPCTAASTTPSASLAPMRVASPPWSHCPNAAAKSCAMGPRCVALAPAPGAAPASYRQ